MRQKLLALTLALTLALSLVPAVQAEEAVTPTPPSWVPEEEYMTFRSDPLYGSDRWEDILQYREAVENGTLDREEFINSVFPLTEEDSVGFAYEIGLICLGAKYPDRAVQCFEAAEWLWYWICGKDEVWRRLQLEEYRAMALHGYDLYNPSTVQWGESLTDYLSFFDMTLEDFFAPPYMASVSEKTRERLAAEMEKYQNRVDVFVDDQQVITTIKAEIKNDRAMVPLRAIAQRLGATVEWIADTREIIITREGHTLRMTVDQTTAYLDGVPVEMDVAPYIVEISTLIPLRYVAEFFGQVVAWDPERRRVDIWGEKLAAGDSNLEAWALAMGAIRGQMDAQNPALFGQTARGDSRIRERLSSEWGVNSREDLIRLVCSMTYHGHNDSFQEAAAIVNSLSDEELETLISQSSETDAYMWAQTKAISEKWGERGILFWDLSRMSNLVQWGYAAKYLTYAEALALLEPAAALTKENFSSWDEAYDNYMDGHVWWSRTDLEAWRADREEQIAHWESRGIPREAIIPEGTQWEAPRERYYYMMKADPDLALLFDDALFTQEIIPVPGITAQQLLEEALGF